MDSEKVKRRSMLAGMFGMPVAVKAMEAQDPTPNTGSTPLLVFEFPGAYDAESVTKLRKAIEPHAKANGFAFLILTEGAKVNRIL